MRIRSILLSLLCGLAIGLSAGCGSDSSEQPAPQTSSAQSTDRAAGQPEQAEQPVAYEAGESESVEQESGQSGAEDV